MITIMGATGNTGGKITEILLTAGEKVRTLGRLEGKLAGFKRAGAEVLAGDAADAVFLTKAFRGSDAVYTLLPTSPLSPDYRAEQNRQGEAITKAIRESGVRYVVALSSIGADLPDGTGLLVGLHEQEERFKELKDVNVMLLRPVSFFENFYQRLGMIRQLGFVSDSVEPNLAIPMIATRDIADVAARALLSRDWKGMVVRELLGQRDLTYPEATRVLGRAIGRADLKYVHVSYDEVVKAFVQGGLSESFARLYVEMTRAFNEGKISPRRTLKNSTPTRFEDFVDELAHAYAEAA